MLVKVGPVVLAVSLIAVLAGSASSGTSTTLLERVRVLERSQERLCNLLEPDYGIQWQ
jgi:hypothetical protein